MYTNYTPQWAAGQRQRGGRTSSLSSTATSYHESTQTRGVGMITADENDFFLEHGYLCVESVLTDEHLKQMQEAFEHVWEVEKAPPCNQHKLLKHRPFIELI